MADKLTVGNVLLEVFGLDSPNEELLAIEDIDALAEHVFVSVRDGDEWIEAGTLDNLDAAILAEEDIAAIDNGEAIIRPWLETVLGAIAAWRQEREDTETETFPACDEDEDEPFDRDEARIQALKTADTIAWELLAQRYYPKCQDLEKLVSLMKENYRDGGILFQAGISSDTIYAAVIAHYRHHHTSYDEEAFMDSDERDESRSAFNAMIRQKVRQFLGMAE